MQLPLWNDIPITEAPPGAIRPRSFVKGTLAPRARAADSDRTVPLILASASPSKIAVLELLGLSFAIVPAKLDESSVSAPTPEALVLSLARLKAEKVFESHPKHLVLGADTLVVDFQGPIGKPSDAPSAIEILRRLSGSTHRVISGIALVDPYTRNTVQRLATSLVRFRPLSSETIERYVATREPFGKSGAYAIQGMGGLLVESVFGEYNNVLGLPVVTLVEALDVLRYELI